jgi:hypothetical protein
MNCYTSTLDGPGGGSGSGGGKETASKFEEATIEESLVTLPSATKP